MTLKRQKKIAVINDFSGFGRCSLMVSVPIISAMKVQCCALPTAILSNHTGYETFFFDDYTDKKPTDTTQRIVYVCKKIADSAE